MRNTGSILIPILHNGDGNVKANFMYSFLEAMGSHPFHVIQIADSLVTRARNVAAAAFLKTEYEYILFWDADIIVTAQQLNWLMENDDSILCGIYPKKQAELCPVLNCLPGTTCIETGGLLEIARGGTGFMRIHREVFEAMKTKENEYGNHGEPQWDFFPVGVRNGEYLSEDWYFSDLARDLGFKIMCDTRIQLRHEGTAVYPIFPPSSSEPELAQVEQLKALL